MFYLLTRGAFNVYLQWLEILTTDLRLMLGEVELQMILSLLKTLMNRDLRARITILGTRSK